jgi:hypothetical protein
VKKRPIGFRPPVKALPLVARAPNERWATDPAPVVVLLVIAMFFTHPMAMVVLALSASLAFAAGLRFRAERGWLWMWAVGLSAIAAVKAWAFWWVPSEYERGQASLSILRFHFDVAVAGLPLLAVLCAWFRRRGLYLVRPAEMAHSDALALLDHPDLCDLAARASPGKNGAGERGLYGGQFCRGCSDRPVGVAE